MIWLWSTWVAQSVKPPTLGFGSGHDLGSVGSSPTSDSALTARSLLGILSLLLSLSASPIHAVSLKINKNLKKKDLYSDNFWHSQERCFVASDGFKWILAKFLHETTHHGTDKLITILSQY